MAGDIFSQGLVPGVILLVYLVINKIIDSRKKDPLKDISKLLTIVTKDIIERDKEKCRRNSQRQDIRIIL